MRKFWMFMYSTPNLVGLGLGVAGLLLYILGIIDAFWYLIIPGLYLSGLLLVPNDRRYALRYEQQASAAEVKQALDGLLRDIKGKVPELVLRKVKNIRETIVEILPHMQSGNSAYNTHLIRQTALEYLPETLENYINLPSTFANVHQLRDGKTAKQLLVEQISLLDEEMRAMATDLVADDAQKMLVHERYLESVFEKGDIFS